MTTLPITDIWYAKEERQRQDLGDLTDLINSIAQIGLINPIVVTREGQLVAGERRLTACKELGLPTVPVRYLEDLTPRQLKLVELDENLKRKDIDWKELVRAVQEYTDIYRADHPDAPISEVATELGFSRTNYQRYMGIAAYLAEDKKNISAAPSISVARGIWERTEQRQRSSAEGELAKAFTPTLTFPSDDEAPAPQPKKTSTHETPIIHGAFPDAYDGPKLNFLHCDFPYGISADKHDQGAAIAHGGYADSEDAYWDLVKQLRDFTASHVADNAHMMFWFSMRFYQSTIEALTFAGWNVNYMPLIWHKTDNRGVIPDYKRGPRQIYETAFLCTRGERFVVKSRANVAAFPTTKEYHMSEKSLPMLLHFFEMFVDDTTVMLDPTCGSGNALIAAHKLGARSVAGIEADENFAALAQDNWRKNA